MMNQADRCLLDDATAISKHWLKRWFFPSKLAKALKEYNETPANSEKLLQVCQAFEKTGFFQRWLFSCISNLIANSSLMADYRFLKSNNLLTGNNLFAFTHCETSKKYELEQGVLRILAEEDLGVVEKGCTQANFDVLIASKFPRQSADAIIGLTSKGLFNGAHGQACREGLKKYQDREQFIPVLQVLAGQNLLNQERFLKLVEHADILFDELIELMMWGTTLKSRLTSEFFDRMIEVSKKCNENDTNLARVSRFYLWAAKLLPVQSGAPLFPPATTAPPEEPRPLTPTGISPH